MAKANDFGVGLMHEAAITASKVGWEPEDLFKMVTNETLMRAIHGVLIGTHEIKPVVDQRHMIDCDADPYIPEKWSVVEHQKGGVFEFDPSKIKLHVSDYQNQKDAVNGNRLREALRGRKVLNANVLDYLLLHPELIPETWKTEKKHSVKVIFFWGTIYQAGAQNLKMIRCLVWNFDRWAEYQICMEEKFTSNYTAAILS